MTPNNLPLQLSSFVGREREIKGIRRLLDPSGFENPKGLPARLVTLTGAGGCGKTRLAFAVGASLADASLGEGKPRPYADGIWLVEFASLADPSLVPQRLASTLDVREQPGQPLLATLTSFLRDKHLLLILDNCEHLIEACAQLAESLLQACPHLQILATSREALNIAGETIFLVPSLEIPNPKSQIQTSDLSQYDSVRLFVERAQSAQPHFVLTDQNTTAVAQICQRLDGIPLAIELAAARVKALSVEQIAARLDDSIHLLTGGSRTTLPRHQTLRAALDWSHALLSEPERALFRRLSVFAGGWTLEAAEAVCGDGVGAGLAPAQTGQPQGLPLPQTGVLDLLTQLVNKSLVLAEERDGETRYRMLEPIRQYAREKLLESGEVEQVQGRHVDFFIKFAEEAEPKIHSADQLMWLNRLEIEHDNLRAAIDWSLESSQLAVGLRLAGALSEFWDTHAHVTEGRALLMNFLSKSEALESTVVRARALIGAGYLAWAQRDHVAARTLLEAALAIANELGNQWIVAPSLLRLGHVTYAEGNFAAARALYEKTLAIYRELEHTDGIADGLAHLGLVALHDGEYEQAQILFRRESDPIKGVEGQMGNCLCLPQAGAISITSR